jgi:hypothetical protein
MIKICVCVYIYSHYEYMLRYLKILNVAPYTPFKYPKKLDHEIIPIPHESDGPS